MNMDGCLIFGLPTRRTVWSPIPALALAFSGFLFRFGAGRRNRRLVSPRQIVLVLAGQHRNLVNICTTTSISIISFFSPSFSALSSKPLLLPVLCNSEVIPSDIVREQVITNSVAFCCRQYVYVCFRQDLVE
jgi:hypothetical protein